ncbi:MAG: hypothetical protein D6803_01830, partial [Anaerolineae bacterium]
MKRSLFLALVAALGLSGCAAFSADPPPTLIPTEFLPTAIALTAQALVPPTSTPAPTPSATPTATLTVTATPTATPIPPTPTPTPVPIIPEADIQIVRPAPLSRVVSPFQLIVHLIPGFNRRATVDLYGEDGRLVYRKIFTITLPNERGSIVRDVTF